LEEGVYLTIEPGLYIPDDPSIPPEFRGLGIRIEDNVFITDGEPFVPTEGTPKTVEHIERVMREK
jgi:Xaa-Pro aminopeptidase